MRREIPATPGNVRDALRHVSPSCDRDTWFRVLAAIKDALGEDGRDIADEWSQQGDSYSKADFRDAWKSIKAGGKVAIGTLWKSALDGGWKPDGEAHQETEAERLERERKQKARAEQADKRRVEAAKKAAAKASALWKASAPATSDHPYLARKLPGTIPPNTLRETTAEQAASILGYAPKSDGEALAGRVLVVPVKIEGKFTTAELIDEVGRKSAIAGGPKSGGVWAAQSFPKGDGDGLTLAFGEGVGTVLSCREAAKWPVFAALSASNLPKVAEILHGQYPKARLLALGDVGGGLKYAEKAAKATGAALAVPIFTPEQIEAFQHQHGKPPTDFNDLHHLAGLDAVAAQLGAALAGAPKAGNIDGPPGPEDSGGATVAGDAGAGTKGKLVPFPGTGKRRSNGKPNPPDGGGDDDDEPRRPSYVVREDWSRYGAPGVWFHNYKNASKGEPEPLDLWLCSPLHIVAVTCGENGHGFGRLLRFKDTFGHWHTWAMPMALLRGSCEEMRGELLDAGVHIDYKERTRLADYLQFKVPDSRILAASRTGWTRDRAAFVLPDLVIPESAPVHFQSEALHQDGEAEKGGSFDTWKAEIAALCAGNRVLALSVCVALAGPLLAWVHRDTGGVHWVGDSSTGKSTALHVGVSVWGGASFLRTWKGTANGFEGVAAARNDTFLPLDEINQARADEVGDIVYMLGNETGKQRAHKVGSARSVYRWRLTVLSTGEKTLETLMAEAGKKPNPGQLVRLLNIPAGRKNGAFDHLHRFPDGKAMADHIKRHCAMHHGHAGPAFVEALLKDGRDFMAALAEVEALPGFKADTSQEARAASRFALYGMAGELAQEWGILPWDEGEALSAAAEGFRLWREAHGGGMTEDRQILQAVADFISRHGDSRFSIKAKEDDKQPNVTTMNRAGWWLDLENDGGRVYLFTPDGLREAVKGHDLNRALSSLDSAGWIHDHDKGKHSKDTRIGARKGRLYWIFPKDLGE